MAQLAGSFTFFRETHNEREMTHTPLAVPTEGTAGPSPESEPAEGYRMVLE